MYTTILNISNIKYVLVEQIAAGVSSPPLVTPSRSFQSFSRTLSQPQPVPETPPTENTRQSDMSASSSSSSSSTTGPSNNSVVTPTTPYQRPSTLHGLKHKLHTAAKSVHSPGRRKSVGHIPLSPLARTPSPSPLPSSPTRSPSPLAFPPGHQPGSSNTTQSYSPGTSVATPGSAPKKGGFGRAKSAEPGSPLLRRALSPDRLHPRTAEKPGPASISPLCDPALKVTITSAPRVTITSKSPPVLKNILDEDKESVKSKPPAKSSLSVQDTDRNNMKMEDEYLLGSSQPLPRIAEEKDSPTALKEELPNIKSESSPALREPPPPIPQKPKSKGSTIKNICTGKKWKNRDSQSNKQNKEEDVSDNRGPSSTMGGSKYTCRK